MLFLESLPPVKFINVYTKPINMQWGESKLKNICLNEMKIDPRAGDVFLFFNEAMDKLKLFFIDASGSQEITKFLSKGGFMLPACTENKIFLKIDRNKLGLIFK